MTDEPEKKRRTRRAGAEKAEMERADAEEATHAEAPGGQDDPAKEPAVSILRRLTFAQWWAVGGAVFSVAGGAFWLGTRSADTKSLTAPPPANNVTVSATSTPVVTQTANPTVIVNYPSAPEKPTTTPASSGASTASATVAVSPPPTVAATKGTLQWRFKEQAQKTVWFGECTGTTTFAHTCDSKHEGAQIWVASKAMYKGLDLPPAQGHSAELLEDGKKALLAGGGGCGKDHQEQVLVNVLRCSRE
jgi:hypothetical protein